VRQLLDAVRLPDGAEVLGPVALGTDERAVLRGPVERGLDLADALRAAQGVRTARKDPDPVRVQVDPLDLV
jgi:primosomal protein N' (replication factor Y)